MSGRTGKLTAEALRERGPRMVLCRGDHDNGSSIKVIFREGQEPFESGGADFMRRDSNGFISFGRIAQSYTLAYLLRIGRFN